MSARPAPRAPGDETERAAPPSDRARLRRLRDRGRYDRELIDAILDEGLVAHLGIVDEHGQPFVIPTLHARNGDLVYCHGSAASRTLRALAGGAPACLTVTLIDGLVLARSAFHHSVNYRSVVLLGQARLLSEPAEKAAALEAVVEHVAPGRWPDVRWPTANELAATAVIALPIDEASAKVRSGPPLDDEDDYALDSWAGVIPLNLAAGSPLPDARLRDGIAAPPYAEPYCRPGSTRPRR
jgi:nitroimidazol reductase NimA-like FMN-containing flavoprotein (pyridoxamine 5'-phosphate oxidase superfamily)